MEITLIDLVAVFGKTYLVWILAFILIPIGTIFYSNRDIETALAAGLIGFLWSLGSGWVPSLVVTLIWVALNA